MRCCSMAVRVKERVVRLSQQYPCLLIRAGLRVSTTRGFVEYLK